MQYAGFTMTPLLGALFGYIGTLCQPITTGIFELNEYNCAAYFLCLLAVLEILALAFVFEEQIRFHEPAVVEQGYSTAPSVVQSTARTDSASVHFGYDAIVLSVFGCLLNFATKGTIAVFETMTTQIASNTLQWDFIQRYTMMTYLLLVITC
jgi:hypothetical protein